MKEIPLTQGQVALVDDDDYDYLVQWKWYALKDKATYYARRAVEKGDGTQIAIIMHRLIMDTPKDMEVDHIDHNGLNNQKSNLRNCTKQQNSRNKQSHGYSKYIGISLNKVTNKFQARIIVNGKSIALGCYLKEDEAARAYDNAAKIYFGEFANLNFK